jgi:hypothetical protein
MPKTYIAYNDEKVIIGFKNSDGELEYAVYHFYGGGTAGDFSLREFDSVAEEFEIDETIMKLKEIK